MMASPLTLPSNPFATRYVRPSVAEYLFPDRANSRQLLADLEATDWWGQVIGPHGSGKSTLLHTLVPNIEAAGRRVVLHSLHQGQRRLGIRRSETSTWDSNTQVVVDGFEQLNWLCRIWLRRVCRRRRAGLLITAHQSVGLPTLWTTPISSQLACRIVSGLLGESPQVHIGREEIDDLFQENRGDMREVLMDLYDVYEQRAADASESQ